MRRSSRLSSSKKPVTVITISSSEDDEPLPRHQQLSPSEFSDNDILEVTEQNSSSPSLPVLSRTPPRAARQPVRSSSTDPRPSRQRPSQQQVRPASQPATEPRLVSARRRLESSSSSSSAHSPNESSSSSSSPSRSTSSSSEDEIRPPKRVPVLASSSDTSSSPTRSQAPNSSQRSPIDDQSQTDSGGIEERARRRKLGLDKIISASKNGEGMEFLVKWRGVTTPERISLKHLRILFPREVVDFMCKRIKWLDSAATSAVAESSESQMSTTSVS